MDSQRLAQITADFMDQLQEMETNGQFGGAGPYAVGDVAIVAEVRRADGTCTIACRWSDPVRRHIVVGMLDSAMGIAKNTING